MELYKNFPKLTALWCCMEIMLYPGQLYGWSSILYVLKQEGFYENLCELETLENNISLASADGQVNIKSFQTDVSKTDYREAYANFSGPNPKVSTKASAESAKAEYKVVCPEGMGQHGSCSENITAVYDDSEAKMAIKLRGCFVQDARLNLWFSIAVAFSYLMCAFLGPLIRRIGMRFFRLFFIVIYVIGALCLGFATPVSPWLICPGLCCIAIAGMALYATSIQVSFLFPSIQSTITALLVGVFDVSTIIPQLIKVGFEEGISRQASYTALAILHIALVGTSTCFFLPATRILPPSVRKARKYEAPNYKQEKETFIEDTANLDKEDSTLALKEIVFSSVFILQIYWMAVKVLRFVTYIGFLNAWLKSLFNNDRKMESYFVGIFSYITMGTVIAGLTAGLVHDFQRKKYIDDNTFRRGKMPIIVPFVLTTATSVACTAFTLVDHEAAIYLSFVMFTFYRSYVYSYEVTYISDAFPLIHFTMLYGILQSCAGLVGLTQYALFGWYEAYESAPTHVNLFLLVLELSTLAHPINIWYQCRQHRNDSKFSASHRKSIHIDLTPSKVQDT